MKTLTIVIGLINLLLGVFMSNVPMMIGGAYLLLSGQMNEIQDKLDNLDVVSLEMIGFEKTNSSVTKNEEKKL